MSENSKAGVAGKGQFKKGADPRRHTNGRKSKEVIAVGKALQEALADEGKRDDKINALVKKIWEKALQGQPWAVDMVFERLAGKVTQPIETDQSILYKIIYDKAAKDKQ